MEKLPLRKIKAAYIMNIFGKKNYFAEITFI